MFKTFELIVPDKNIQIMISSVLAFFICLRTVPMIIQICKLRGLLENPVKRSSHFSPTPTFGGIAIFTGTFIAYFLWSFKDEDILMHRVLAGVLILFFLGLKDDLFSISPTKKMLSQIIASIIVVIGSDLRIDDFFGIFGITHIPYIISVIFTIFIFIALINAFNLIDGIDGLAGSIGMIASGGFGLWFLLNQHYSLACLAMALSGSLLGFLRHNFSDKTKIFMGDTGSLIIGYMITVFAVKFIHFNVMHSFNPSYSFVSAPVIAIVMLVVPIFDTLRVFSIRILRKKSPFKADRLHMHHLIVDNGLSHLESSLVLSLITIALTGLTYYARHYFSNNILCIFIILLFAIYLVVGNWLETRRIRVKKIKDKTTRSIAIKFKDSISAN